MKLLLIFFFVVASTLALELPPQFSDNMVLQRGVENRIWGKRKPNAKDNVFVQFDGPPKIHKVEKSSRNATEFWSVTLPKIESNGAGTLTIWEGKEDQKISPIIFKNVLVGDVWIFALPRDVGFSKPPSPASSLDLRILNLSKAAEAVEFLAPNTNAWSFLSKLPTVDVLASQIAAQFHGKFTGVPLGLVIVPDENLDLAFPISQWKEISAAHTNLLYKALNGSLSEMRNERTAIEMELIQLKHDGKVGNARRIPGYGEFRPYLWRDYPKALATNEWSFKGIILRN